MTMRTALTVHRRAGRGYEHTLSEHSGGRERWRYEELVLVCTDQTGVHHRNGTGETTPMNGATDVGLDNIPASYPCRTEGTAVTDGDTIDCMATMSAGGCPWRREVDKRGGNDGQLLGMFGTLCWYRGGDATSMIAELCEHDRVARVAFEQAGVYPNGLYGDENQKLSVDYLYRVADTMEATARNWDTHLADGGTDGWSNEEWSYAAWWCRFAAGHCDGATAWY